MNRIVLKVNLLKDNGLKIILFHLDERFLSDKNKNNTSHFFNNPEQTFIIYSNKEMFISHNSFRVPDKEHYKSVQEASHNFKTEEERYEYLKKLHHTLSLWNSNFVEFRLGSDYKRRNKKMILSGEFWVI